MKVLGLQVFRRVIQWLFGAKHVEAPRTVIFGLTGGIASGKSTVARVFEAEGVPIIDADLVARKIVVPGQPALKDIVALLGPGTLLPDGTMDRKFVGGRIFHDEALRKTFDGIVEPWLRRAIDEECAKLRAEHVPLVCLDAPLLIEKGWHEEFRPLVLVVCSREAQVERLMKRNNLPLAEALARVASQLNPEARRSYADHLIITGELWDGQADVPLEQVAKRAREVLARIRTDVALRHY